MVKDNRCGAKNRAGLPCQRYKMPNGRCMMHGGKSIGKPNNQHAKKEGSMYSKFMSEEDQAIANLAEDKLGKLDSEIKTARVQLARAIKEQANGGTKDYDFIIDRALARIGNLEKTRKELLHDDSQDNILTIVGGLPD
jgi:hypothetical protein